MARMPHYGTMARPESLGLCCVIREDIILGPTGPCPKLKEARESKCEEGVLGGGGCERDIRVHWRQESSLCKGTEVWEGRVWYLGKQTGWGSQRQKMGGQPRDLHPQDYRGLRMHSKGTATCATSGK